MEATLYLCPIIDTEHYRALNRGRVRERDAERGKGSKEEVRGESEGNWR